ncbi:MAG: HEAT repeat domain-containing protein [Deltaproteobacteria bacterium]|nr:HEAT repeat domain-containing protein [Deltaproteobacteria bacterium]
MQRQMDVKIIHDLIHALNMAVSKLASYPSGHPFVLESFEKVEEILDEIFAIQPRLVLKIGKNTIVVGSSTLDPQNPIFARFAGTLFEHGIIGLILEKGLATEELMAFNRIISQKRNDVQREGGIEALLARENVRHLQTRLIDYGLFSLQDGEEGSDLSPDGLHAATFWERFVRGFFQGALVSGGEESKYRLDMDPGELASILNEWYSRGGMDDGGTSFKACMENLRGLYWSGDELLVKRMVTFIKSLDSELRDHFLQSFFTILSDDIGMAEDILADLPVEIILEALERHTKQGMYIPPNILKISQKLARKAVGMNGEGADMSGSLGSREELLDKLKIIFKEDETDKFVPADYKRILHKMIAVEEIVAPGLASYPQLEETLTAQNIESGVNAIMVEIISNYDADEAIPEEMLQNLRNRCLSLARSADFQAAAKILERIGQRRISPEEVRNGSSATLVEVVADSDFTYEVLNSMDVVDKEHHHWIAELVAMTGTAFVDPLLDRLAEEENKALRLYYLGLLKQMGGSIRDHILRRLKDKRWYFVRNLLVILRQLDDPSILEPLHSLLNHTHPRVRQELLYTLLVLGDPKADKILLEELNSAEQERRLKAVSMAGKATSPEVVAVLVGFLQKRGLDHDSFTLKKASVHALAEIGAPSVLPVLSHILRSFVLFRRQRAHLLKLEIIDSLSSYAAEDVGPMLQKISSGRPHDLAVRALQVLKSLKVDKSCMLLNKI